jgi:hypothetical protein
MCCAIKCVRCCWSQRVEACVAVAANAASINAPITAVIAIVFLFMIILLLPPALLLAGRRS